MIICEIDPTLLQSTSEVEFPFYTTEDNVFIIVNNTLIKNVQHGEGLHYCINYILNHILKNNTNEDILNVSHGGLRKIDIKTIKHHKIYLR